MKSKRPSGMIIKMPHSFTGIGFDAETEAMLTKAGRLIKDEARARFKI